MSKWTFPLHFIDFETARGVLPYFKGQKPNELIAFQFSHHVIYENGDIEHSGQYLEVGSNQNPNLNFIRELKCQLSSDNGTIFCFSDYEMVVLAWLKSYVSEVGCSDSDEIILFIDDVLGSNCERRIVDLMEVYKSFIYLPETKGSNSIKEVLPAVLNQSNLIQTLYAEPIYGSRAPIKSLNFYHPVAWIKKENGRVINPYELLPIMNENSAVQLKVKNGGAAQAAYSILQSKEVEEGHAQYLRSSLLQYCELDTLAMIMIYQYFTEVVNSLEYFSAEIQNDSETS